MKSVLKFAGLALVASLALTGCKKGPEGKWSLDKTAMKDDMEKGIAKMPPEEQAMAKMLLTMVDNLEMNLELVNGGKATMTMVAPNPFDPGQEPRRQTVEGTWKVQGDKMHLEVTGEQELVCSHAGTRMECGEGDKRIYFVRA